MPVWAAALITVLAALGSGLGGVLLSLRHDGRERWRDRLISAADDFAVGFAEALVAARQAMDVIDGYLTEADDMKTAHEVACAQRDAALTRTARLDLLFGRGTPTTIPPVYALQYLADCLNAMSPPDIDLAAAKASHLRAAAFFDEFQVAAAAAIRPDDVAGS